MIANDDEVEIKIEYNESIEKDPLSHKANIITFNDDCRSALSTINNDENLLDYLQVDNNEIPVHYECNDPDKQGAEAKWHKLVDNSGKYVCKFCDLTYSTVQTLRYHVKIKHTGYYQEIINSSMHREVQRKIKCYICKKKFKDISELNIHSKTHDLNNTKNICFVCYATFEQHNDLLSHITNEHEETKKKLHICSTCGYNTPKAYHYKQHMNAHTNINKIKCNHCSYTTNRSTNMKIHEQTHSIDKTYVCVFEGCEYRSTTAAGLRSHRLIHNKDKYMLYCDKCSYSTIYIQNLDKHLDSHKRDRIRIRT